MTSNYLSYLQMDFIQYKFLNYFLACNNDRDILAYDGNAGKTESKIKDKETNYFSSSVKYTLLYVEVTNYTVSNIEYIYLLH